MFNNNTQDSNKAFQKSLDGEQRRRNREDDRLRLRKQDRESRLQQKRRQYQQNSSSNNNNNNNNNNVNSPGSGNGNNNNNYNSEEYNQQSNQESQKKAQQMLMLLPQYVKGCFQDHPGTQFECAQRIRKLLSIEKNPPIEQVIQSGVVPRLVQFLRMHQYDKIQFESAWALTNIASGNAEHTASVIRNGAVPALVSLLNSKSIEVREQAVWALGNIAGDSPECRNLVLKHKALEYLIPLCQPQQITSKQQLGLIRNATWTLSNFCRGKPQPHWDYIRIALRALCSLLQVQDDEILQDSCWAYSYLSDIDDYDSSQIFNVIRKSGGLKKLVELLKHPSPHVRHPALRTIGNIVTGDDTQTQHVINAGVLKQLLLLLKDPRPPIKREACWTISNITAGSQNQIEAVITANLIPGLIEILRNEKYEITREALWAIANATSGSTDIQIVFLVSQGVIPPLCNLLRTDYGHKSRDKDILIALQGIENILKTGVRRSKNGINQFAQYVEECGGTDYLERLQSDQSLSDNIYEKAAHIIREYFNEEETNLDSNDKSNKEQIKSEVDISGNLDDVNGELIFSHGLCHAWRLDEEQNEWRGRGKGKISIHYNKIKQRAKIVFFDDKHDKTRLLQYVVAGISAHHPKNNVEEKENIMDEEGVAFFGTDYSMDKEEPLHGYWKLSFPDCKSVAEQFLNTYNSYSNGETDDKISDKAAEIIHDLYSESNINFGIDTNIWNFGDDVNPDNS